MPVYCAIDVSLDRGTTKLTPCNYLGQLQEVISSIYEQLNREKHYSAFLKIKKNLSVLPATLLRPTSYCKASSSR